FLELVSVQRIFRAEERAERSIAVRAQSQNARPVRRLGPVYGAVRLVHALVNHGLQTQTRGDLAHLVMESASVDHPHKARVNSHYLLLPAQSFHALLKESFTARETDRHLQEISVEQLHPAFL